MFGCSIHTDVYVQNLSNENKTIIIKYKTNISDPDKERYFGRLNFQYAEGLYNRKKFKDNNETLQSVEKTVSDSSIQLILPARSTVRIDKSVNYNCSWHIDYLEIENRKITLEEFQKNTEYQKFAVLYNIR
jgi:hypothetical protein